MGRDQKSKKSTLEKVSKGVGIVLAPIIYELLVLLISQMSFGTKWEEMKDLNLSFSQMFEYLSGNFWIWFSLVICRIIVYILPAVIFYLASLFNKKDKRKKQINIFLKCLNWQFLGYLIYQCITVVLGLDYLIGLEPFNNISIFIAFFGYLFTLSKHKDIEFGKITDDI